MPPQSRCRERAVTRCGITRRCFAPAIRFRVSIKQIIPALNYEEVSPLTYPQLLHRALVAHVHEQFTQFSTEHIYSLVQLKPTEVFQAMAALPTIAPGDHLEYMRLALSLARKSPPMPTNFCVGAVLVDGANNRFLSTGYTLELPGNTHAEQCCFAKFAAEHNVSEERVGDVLPAETVLYTTMEPCGKRSVGNLPCVERILKTKEGPNGGINTVYLGVREPETFVGENVGRAKLEENGIRCVHVPGLEDDILMVATAGHEKVK